jgi:hypothetical protein
VAKPIVVYTAIFGAYDDPPTVSQVDPAISYLLFADGTVSSVPSPWELRPLPAIFVDPQRDARRLKALPHLFLPEGHNVSVWIDGNCEINDLTADAVLTMLDNAELAVPAHEERGCVFEEAKALLALGVYDSPARIARQMTAYEIAGLPRHVGLHHTNFLIRRHAHPACIHFCTEWWEQISHHSKRDQLSFDFVRWKLPQATVRTIPIRYTENALFRSRSSHRFPHRVVSEHVSVGVRWNDLAHQFLAAPYLPQYDAWPQSFLDHLRRINAIVAATGEPLEGNLCYFHQQENFLYSSPDPRRGARRETFLRALAGRRRLLEIGFNAGHSTLLALTHSDVSVTAIDIGAHAYTEPAAAYLQEAFGERFQFIKLDSRQLPTSVQAIDVGGHDIINIDGAQGADVFANDISSAVAYGKPGMLVVINDIYVPAIRHITNRLVSDGLLAPYGDLQTMESGTYVVLEFARPYEATYHGVLTSKILEEVEALLRGDGQGRNRFQLELMRHLNTEGALASSPEITPARPQSGEAASLSVPPLDSKIINEIRRIGFHPFVLVRIACDSAESRFVICETQNEAADFAEKIAADTTLTNSRLLRGIARAMQMKFDEAAELLFGWLTDENSNQSETIYLELPAGIELPEYYNYPVFEIAAATTGRRSSVRADQLIVLLHAYERADGNDQSRFVLIEVLALAVSRYMGIQNRLSEAAEIIARAIVINPASRRLAAAVNALEMRLRPNDRCKRPENAQDISNAAPDRR